MSSYQPSFSSAAVCHNSFINFLFLTNYKQTKNKPQTWVPFCPKIMTQKNIAILMTCFNRKDKTLSCLDSLYKNEINNNITIQIYIVDDCSSDGTASAIKDKYQDVIVIKGTGSLFWNGGMRRAWQAAMTIGFDFYLWINDDVFLYPDAVIRIVYAYNILLSKGERVGAIVGTMVDPVSKVITYGGRSCNSIVNPISFGDILKPTNDCIECDFINGNFTLITADAVNHIGILSDKYTHSMGDFDYGLRLKKSNVSCWVAPQIFGECMQNRKDNGCFDLKLPLKKRMVKLKEINQMPPVNEWLYFVRTHGGLIWPLLYLKGWIRGKFPILWLLMRSHKI